ncbi:MAG: DMT family transporter [Epsilonproteobacteria bacterium]|nr:DMT family transporter [Campylobacterota bacterium]
MKKFKEFLADISLISVALSWGITFAIVQDAIKDVPVFSFLFLRFFLSFVIMGAISLRFIKDISMPLIRSGLFLGALFFSGYAFQTYGLTYTKSSIVAFITGLNVIIVPIVAFFVFKQKVRLYSIIGAFLATVGLWLLTGANGIESIGKGEVYSFLCAVFFAVHIVYTSISSKKYNVFLLVSVQLFTVAMLSLVFSLAIDPFTMPKHFSPSLLIALGATVIFATVYALFVQTYMQQFTTPAKTAVIFTIEPASAAVFGYFYLHETLSLMQIIGGVVMIFAILIAELGSYALKD